MPDLGTQIKPESEGQGGRNQGGGKRPRGRLGHGLGLFEGTVGDRFVFRWTQASAISRDTGVTGRSISGETRTKAPGIEPNHLGAASLSATVLLSALRLHGHVACGPGASFFWREEETDSVEVLQTCLETREIPVK